MSLQDKDYIIAEYSCIKQEIFTTMNQMDQLIILEYTVSVAFLAASLEFRKSGSVIIILNFLLVLAIQELVNTRRRHLARAVIYIQEVLEKDIDNLRWEKNVEKIDEKYRELYLFKTKTSKVFYFLVNNGVVVISIISIILYYYIRKNLSFYDVVIWIFFIICLRQCYYYSDFKKIKDRYFKIISDIDLS